MRHSYEPDLNRLGTAESILQYLGEGCSPDQLELVNKSIQLVLQMSVDGSMSDQFEVAALLKELGTDYQSIIAAVLGGNRVSESYPLESLSGDFGEQQLLLVKNVRWLNSFSAADIRGSQQSVGGKLQAERVRQLVLVMVEDVRALLVKLAFRVIYLKKLLKEPDGEAQNIARETLDVYAPLANRLGVAQLKWQLEICLFVYSIPIPTNELPNRSKNDAKTVKNLLGILSTNYPVS